MCIRDRVNEGLVKRIQGKGLFVAGKLKERNLGELGGFTQTVRKEEAFPGRKLLFREVRPAGIKSVSYTHLDVYKRQHFYIIILIPKCDTFFRSNAK